MSNAICAYNKFISASPNSCVTHSVCNLQCPRASGIFSPCMDGHEVPVSEAIRWCVPLSLSQQHCIGACGKIQRLSSGKGSCSQMCMRACVRISRTSWRGECDVQIPSPGVFNAGLHLYMLQWVDCVVLPCTGFGWNLYSDLPSCFQLPMG